MCGIIAHWRKDNAPASKQVIKRYHKQKERGMQGFGYVAFEPQSGAIATIRRRTKEADILTELKKETAPAFIFHHRLPTSTPNLKEAAHPITTKTKRRTYYTIHNGIISNATERKTAHTAAGYSYTTEIIQRTQYIAAERTYWSMEQKHFNDSEALAIDLARYLDGETESIESIGSVAAIVLETENRKARALHWIRNNGNPLKVENTKQLLTIRSEGDGEEAPPHILHTLDLQSGAIATRPLEIKSTTSSFGGYGLNPYHYNSRGFEDDAENEELLVFTPRELLDSGYDREELQEDYEDEIAYRVEALRVGGLTASERACAVAELDELRGKLRALNTIVYETDIPRANLFG